MLMMTFLLSGCSKTVPAENLKSFHFSYSTGTMSNSSVSYDLSYKDGVYTASVKPDGVAEEDASVYIVDEAFVSKLEAALQENHVERWNGFQKSNPNVMDGNGFSFSYYTMDLEGCSASGYMSWPGNYGEVKAAIEGVFAQLY